MTRAIRILCGVVLLGLPSPAAAHLHLESSTPAKDATATTAVREISLVFTERVDAQYTDIAITDESGKTFQGIVSIAGTDSHTAILTLPDNLYTGRYTVHWRAAGNDGHVVADSFHFSVNAPAPPPPVESARLGTDPDPDSVGAARAQDARRGSIASTPAAVVVRWLTFAAILLTIGSVVFRTAVLGRAAQRSPDATSWDVLLRTTRGVAIFAAASVLVMLVPRLLLHSIDLHGAAQMLDGANLRHMITSTLWGRGWMLQLVAGIICLYGAIRATEATGWTFMLVGSVLLAFSPAFSGHAAAMEQSVVITVANDALHVFGASAWVGTLAVLFIVVLARLRTGAPALAGLIACFSPVALLGAAVAVITGTVAGLAHLGPLSDLWRTEYGRALSLKLAAFAATATAGFINWRIIKPSVGTDRGGRVLRGSATVELVFAVLIVLFTAVLVALPLP